MTNKHPLIQMLDLRARMEGRPMGDLDSWKEDPALGRLVRRNFLKPENSEFHAVFARHLMITDRALRMLRELKKAGIEGILVKGVPLSLDIYPNPIHRGMEDIDLLVRKKDFVRTVQQLIGAGYILYHDDTWKRILDVHGLTADSIHMVPTLDGGLHLSHTPGEITLVDATGTLVDVHWSLSPGIWLRGAVSIPEEPLFLKKRTISVQKESIETLSLEDSFCYLCYNLSRNGFLSHKTYLDLFYLLQKLQSTADKKETFKRIAETAKEWKVQLAVFHTVELMEKFFAIPRIEELHNFPGISFLRRSLLRIVASPERILTHSDLETGDRFFWWVQLLSTDSIMDIFRIIFALLIPDRKWLQLRYNRKSRFLHLLHIVRTVAGNGRFRGKKKQGSASP